MYFNSKFEKLKNNNYIISNNNNKIYSTNNHITNILKMNYKKTNFFTLLS